MIRKIVWQRVCLSVDASRRATRVRMVQMACGHGASILYTLPRPRKLWCRVCYEKTLAKKGGKT